MKKFFLRLAKMLLWTVFIGVMSIVATFFISIFNREGVEGAIELFGSFFK